MPHRFWRTLVIHRLTLMHIMHLVYRLLRIVGRRLVLSVGRRPIKIKPCLIHSTLAGGGLCHLIVALTLTLTLTAAAATPTTPTTTTGAAIVLGGAVRTFGAVFSRNGLGIDSRCYRLDRGIAHRGISMCAPGLLAAELRLRFPSGFMRARSVN